MNKEPHYHQDKRLLALFRETNQLYRRQREWVPLDPPIQRGWVRRWRLTAAALKRSDAKALQAILLRVNTQHFHWRRSFEYGKHRRGKMITLNQGFLKLHEGIWKRLGWPEDWKKYFRRRFRYGCDLRQPTWLKFDRRDLVELHIERHFIWRAVILDPEVESRLHEIDGTLGFEGRLRIYYLIGARNWKDPNHRHRQADRIAQKRIRAAMAGDTEAEINTSHSACSSLPRPPGHLLFISIHFHGLSAPGAYPTKNRQGIALTVGVIRSEARVPENPRARIPGRTPQASAHAGDHRLFWLAQPGSTPV